MFSGCPTICLSFFRNALREFLYFIDTDVLVSWNVTSFQSVLVAIQCHWWFCILYTLLWSFSALPPRLSGPLPLCPAGLLSNPPMFTQQIMSAMYQRGIKHFSTLGGLRKYSTYTSLHRIAPNNKVHTFI